MFMPDQFVWEVMSERVIGIDISRSVIDTLRLSSAEQVHHFPVFDQHRLVGMVCTCDLARAPLESPVGNWMHTDVERIGPQETTREAARLMEARAVGSLLVEDVRGIRGIVTRDDLAERGDDPDIAASIGQCACCGSRQHLCAGPDGLHLCQDCQERAREKDWFEIGTAD